MSDKVNKSIQDRGWEAMNTLLDKEMPVKKKKRRVIFWFPIAAAVVLGLVFLVNEATRPLKDFNSEDVVNRTDEIAFADLAKDKNEHTTIGGNPQATSKSIVTPTQSIEKIQEVQRFSSVSINNQNSKTKNTVAENKSANKTTLQENLEKNNKSETYVSEDQGAMTTVLTDKTLNSSKNESEEELSDSQKNSGSVVSEKEHGRMERALFEEIPFLELKKRTAVQYNELATSSFPIAVTSSFEKEYQLAPYVVAKGLYQFNKPALGYGGGLGLDYGNSDFGFFTEVSYVRSDYIENSNGPMSFADASFEIVEDNGANQGGVLMPNGNFAVRLDNFENLTQRIDEIQFDFGIRKSITKRIGWVAGLIYSRFSKVENTEIDIILDETTTDIGLNGVYYLGNTVLQEAGVYNKFDIVPHFGLELTITPNIYFGMDYNHGLINLLSNEDQETLNVATEEVFYRRNISWNLRYSF